MREKLKLDEVIVCVVGLGYAGLPLAEAFSKSLKVIGFDIDSSRVEEIIRGNTNQNLLLSHRAQEMAKADIIIICVPTPVTKSKEPDLSYVRSAAETVGRNMKKGSTVILESTVYPGVTEEVVKPILEESGLRCGKDFKIGYSPERINPGDKEHTIDKVTKVVAGIDEETTELMAGLYSIITPHVFKAKDIKTAEAAKVIENIQRDLNIALMNELSLIFEKLGLSSRDVIDAAATKWNFHRYSPGLIGGHCIPIDPYYLVYKAKELGYHPQVILAGRAINDYMPKHIVEMTIKALNNADKVIKGSKVLIVGLTYKENVDDIRETPAREIIKGLREYGVEIFGYEPLLGNIGDEFGIKCVQKLEEAPKVDCVILATAQDSFRKMSPDYLKRMMANNPILIDIRGVFDPREATESGVSYYCL